MVHKKWITTHKLFIINLQEIVIKKLQISFESLHRIIYLIKKA
jgi:hypothetical protein